MNENDDWEGAYNKNKMAAIEKTKSFIKTLKEVLDDMEFKLNGDDDDDHVRAVISGNAMMECMSSYNTKIKDTMERVEDWHRKRKLN